MRKLRTVLGISTMALALLTALACASGGSRASAADHAGPARLDVRAFGAVGDGTTLNTAALQKAIDAAASKGGGTIEIPAGTWLSGPLFLKSGITLHLDSGAVLKASRRIDDYPIIEGRWEGFVVRHRASLVTAVDAERVAVVGRGVIDGQGDPWWETVRQRKALEKKGVPAESIPDIPRPRLLNFIRCKGVLVQGVKLINSPAWTIHPAFCEDVVVDGVTIDNPEDSPNTDGINPDSCVNVRIANCLLHCGDDCITLKSGKDEEGRRIGRPTENVTIANCVMLTGHGGVVIGSEMSGGVRDVAITGCVFRGTDQGIRIKSQRGRGGVVENVVVSGIAMHDIVKNGIILTSYYSGSSEQEPVTERTPIFRNLTFSNIRINGASAAASLEGLEEMPLQGVVLANIDARTSAGLTVKKVSGLTLDRVSVNIDKGPALAIENSSNIKIDDFAAAQRETARPAMILKETSGAWIRNCQAEAGQKTFLGVEGPGSRDILLTGNNLPGGKRSVALGGDVHGDAVAVRD